MAAEGWREDAPVVDRLAQQASRFEFFQAVRLMWRIARAAVRDRGADGSDHEPADGDDAPRGATVRRPVGQDYSPRQEFVRFRAVAAHTFPACEVSRLVLPRPAGGGRPPTSDALPRAAAGEASAGEAAAGASFARESFAGQAAGGAPVGEATRSTGPNGAPADDLTAALRAAHLPPPEMYVTFLGLTGPQGVLPRHYTSLVIDRLREKDRALAEFLDLFNHRIVSLFYRAWEKYRFPIAWERCRIAADREAPEDLFTSALYCLVGLGTPGLRGRQAVDDETWLYYAGHFAHRPRSAVALEIMLADYLGDRLGQPSPPAKPARRARPLAGSLRVEVRQFQGEWLQLSRDDQSALPRSGARFGQHCRLGVDVVAGERVWDVQGKFRIRLGPLGYADFRRFMPCGDLLRIVCQFTRTYVGPEFHFDVQPMLRKEEVPSCRLSPTEPPQLGWNTWIRSAAADRDADDVVFALSAI
jgi:type VI secretion system protein ImpH